LLPFDALLHIFGMIETVSSQYPSTALIRFKSVDIWSAAHAVFQVFVAKTT